MCNVTLSIGHQPHSAQQPSLEQMGWVHVHSCVQSSLGAKGTALLIMYILHSMDILMLLSITKKSRTKSCTSKGNIYYMGLACFHGIWI